MLIIAFVIAAAVIVTAIAVWAASKGAASRQEDLNTHGYGIVEPAGRRPADAAAEAMGVDGPGQPDVDPDD